MKTYLFAYGRLQPQYNPPATLESHIPDSVYGDLHDIGRDPAATNIGGDYTEKIHGTLMAIDSKELRYLDEEETGFKRIETKTNNGKKAWMYVWDGKLPTDAKIIKKWPVK